MTYDEKVEAFRASAMGSVDECDFPESEGRNAYRIATLRVQVCRHDAMSMAQCAADLSLRTNSYMTMLPYENIDDTVAIQLQASRPLTDDECVGLDKARTVELQAV